MSFTSFDYALFLPALLAMYWLLPHGRGRQVLLVAASYVFYGYIHPWFCWLIAASTLVDFFCGLGMARWPSHNKQLLGLSLTANLGLLAAFKYFDFFAQSVGAVLSQLGLETNPATLDLFLPVGISFYTFQTLSYSIDVYRGRLQPTRDPIAFTLYVALFPQLVAGPIERASHLLPQVQSRKVFDWNWLPQASALIARGLIKKLLVADNVAPYVDQVFLLREATWLLLFAGTVGFAIQIYADFSAYTDIARGSARLFGFELMENFRAPYLAVTPSDFWRRWHISLSSWIHDYLYQPLGGSRVRGRWRFLGVLLASLGLSGLWHGAAWNFVAWGTYHALILFAYHLAGKGGRWQPPSRRSWLVHWAGMSCLTLLGWLVFRTPSLGWLVNNLVSEPVLGAAGDSLLVSISLVALLLVYALPLLLLLAVDRAFPRAAWLQSGLLGLLLVPTVLLARTEVRDFIYFQF